MLLNWSTRSQFLRKSLLPSTLQYIGGPCESQVAMGTRRKTTKQVPYEKLDEFALRSINQPGKGKMYDKKPFKFLCEKGKTYLWCTCGWSKSQPFCDGHHKNPHFRIKLKPILFVAPETKEYWFCNCKQTSQRPFCDGTHRLPEIQAAVKS